MPKKNGVNKTYCFSFDTIEKLKFLCEKEMRTQTNVIEMAIRERFERMNNTVQKDREGC